MSRLKAHNTYHLQVEQLDEEVAQLRQALADKQEQETAMLQVSFCLFVFVLGLTYVFSCVM